MNARIQLIQHNHNQEPNEEIHPNVKREQQKKDNETVHTEFMKRQRERNI